MEEWGLPGLQARYEFVPAGETVELRLDLRFAPAKSGLSQAARRVWLELRDRLAEGAGDEAPPAAVNLVTSLASTPLTVTADGAGLRERFVDFVSDLAASPTEGDAPVTAALAFSLPKAGAAKLPGDMFELDVRLEIGPVPIAVASPRLDEDGGALAFATAFEEAWQGFDGADGRIALAVEDRPEGAAFWCVRAGAKSGIALAVPARAEIAYHAAPPLSAALLSGTIEGDSGAEQFVAVDLDSWWDSFVAGFDRLEAAAGSGEVGDRFRRARTLLVAGKASRLLPVAKGEPGNGLAEVRALYEAMLEAELSSRPVVGSAAVQVSRGVALFGEPPAVLHGRAMTPAATEGAAIASPAAVRLTRGLQGLAHAVPPSDDGIRRPSPVRFEADRIERKDAPPLRLLLGARGETDALGPDLGRPTPPAPRIEAPSAPGLSVSARAFGDPATLSEALAWSVKVEARTTFRAQDRLELALGFADEAEAGDPPGSADNSLFEPIVRAARFAASIPAKPDPEQIERFAALAEAVAEALHDPPPPVADISPLPGRWRYAVDFRELPALIVSRETTGAGQLPPWPAVTGFVAPASDEGQARFEPEADAPAAQAGLRLIFPGARLMADRAVQVHGRIVRNQNLADPVEPAFVYPGAIESTPHLLRPLLEWRAPEPEPRTAGLAAALTDLLGAIDEKSGAPYGLALEAALLRRLEAEGEIRSRLPLCLLPVMELGGEDDRPVADLARTVAAALSEANARLGPEGGGGDEEIALTIALFEGEPARAPLARLEVRIPIPADRTWWGPSTRT